MRTVITELCVRGSPDFSEARPSLEHPAAIQWLQNTSESQLIALFVQMRGFRPRRRGEGLEVGSGSSFRVVSALSFGTSPGLRFTCVLCEWQSYPEGIQNSLRTVLQRSGSEAGADTRQVLSAKLLRFAFDKMSTFARCCCCRGALLMSIPQQSLRTRALHQSWPSTFLFLRLGQSAKTSGVISSRRVFTIKLGSRAILLLCGK